MLFGLCLCLWTSLGWGQKVINVPWYEATNTYMFDIVKMELTNEATIITGQVNYFPNEWFRVVGRTVLRGFGYELDVTKLPEEDRAKIPGQVALYHKYHALMRSGDYYRIASYSQNDSFDCYEVVAKDQSEALITFVQVLGRPNVHSRRVRIPGLDEKKKYRVETTGEVYCGDTLLHAGLNVPAMWGDFQSALIHLSEVSDEQ